VTHRRSCLLLCWSIAAGVAGCGNGPASMGDAGLAGVLYDRPPTDGCGAITCNAGQVTTGPNCVCTPLPFGAMYTTVRTACSQIATGRPRTPARDYCVDGASGMAPDLSCMMTPLTRGTPQMVTLWGVVDIFANGGNSDGITVEVFQEGAGGALGAMVGSYTSTTNTEAGATAHCDEDEILVDSSGVATGESRRLGFFHIENVPTETPLIVRTMGDSGLWSPLYTYNFQILNSEIAPLPATTTACIAGAPTGMGFEYRMRVLSRNDYVSIPLTAGLASGIRSGHGALAGEIHDCADVRLEWAQVGMTGNPMSKVYFNDIADNPLPDSSRTQGTSLLGLYSGLDIAPGPVDVSAVGYVGGQTVSLGYYHAQVFADAVTVVSLRGLRATQVP
jgi:hypothetical protein